MGFVLGFDVFGQINVGALWKEQDSIVMELLFLCELLLKWVVNERTNLILIDEPGSVYSNAPILFEMLIGII